LPGRDDVPEQLERRGRQLPGDPQRRRVRDGAGWDLLEFAVVHDERPLRAGVDGVADAGEEVGHGEAGAGRGHERTFQAGHSVRPPSTVNTVPLTYPASGDARKATAAATSRGAAARPAGMAA